MKEKQICCLCGKEFEGYGNNPYPLVKDEGARCCDECNNDVIMARIAALVKDKEDEEEEE